MEQEPPSATGSVLVPIFNGGPQYNEARDAQGRMVVAGFLGQSRDQLNAESTAELLGFFAIGGGYQRHHAATAFLEGVDELPSFGDVVAAVETQLVNNGYVAGGESPVKEALLALRQEVPIGNNNSLTASAPATRGTLVEPNAQLGGISLDTILDDEFKLTNSWLRRSYAYLDKMAWKEEDGTIHTDFVPIKEFWIDMPSRYGGLVGFMSDYCQGKIPYSEVVMGPYPIPAVTHPDSTETIYRLTVVGLGGHLGDYNDLTEAQKDQQEKVVFYTFFVDLVMSTIANVVLPVGGDGINELTEFALGSAAVTDFINICKDTMPTVIDQAKQGLYTDALFSFLNAVETSNTMFPIATALITDLVNHVGGGNLISVEDFGQRFDDVFATLGFIDLGLSIIDMNLFIGETNKSNRADIFTITSSSGKVTITADKTSLPPTDISVLTAVIQNKNPDAVYQYEWSVNDRDLFRANDSFGKNTDNQANGLLVTSQENVALVSKDFKPGTAIVTCTVRRIDHNQNLIVDTATINIHSASRRIQFRLMQSWSLLTSTIMK